MTSDKRSHYPTLNAQYQARANLLHQNQRLNRWIDTNAAISLSFILYLMISMDKGEARPTAHHHFYGIESGHAGGKHHLPKIQSLVGG